MFGCFNPITGGRVSEIIGQEAKLCGKNDSLPLSKNDDKIEKFCDTYKEFIDVRSSHEIFSRNWEKIKQEAVGDLHDKRNKWMLVRALSKSFFFFFFMAFVSKMVWSIIVIFSIGFFVFDILAFIRARSKKPPTAAEKQYALILCGLFFVAMYVLSVGVQQMGIYSSILGSKVKAALTTAIYKKMIVREAYNSKADVVSLVAKDVEKLAEACLSLQFLWSGIFETVTVFVVLLVLMGSSILPGLGLMCVFLPLQYGMGLVVAFKKKELSRVSNTRISLMEEILRGVKLIKIYGWDTYFWKKVEDIRANEALLLGRINRIKSAILGLIFSLPPLMCMVIFGTKEATGEIETVLVFTTLSFFNTLRVPFSKLPKSLRDVLDGISCLERLQDFLLEPELEFSQAEKQTVSAKHKGIIFQNVSLSYGNGAPLVLRNINLNIPEGSLMMVAGPVASGKSNLLKSILGHLTVREGNCHTSPSKAYVPQTPWTALGTVRDNIVFGNPYDEVYYRKVIFACALETDLELMAEGDMTWIGERGGNLSGGQKQRIALARAAYSRADLYVLDSPLSAVDMYTCQHIFKHCIQELMIGNGGTVVLATHQTELFSKSDHLVVMRDGVMAYNDSYVYEGIKHLFPNFAGETEIGESLKEEKSFSTATRSTKKRSVPNAPVKALASKPTRKEVEVVDNKPSIYIWYLHRIGVLMFLTATLIFIIGQILRVYSDAWIAVWTTRKFSDRIKTSDKFYILMYFFLVMLFLTVAFIRAFFWYYIGGVAANRIHTMSFGAALKAPMHYFHVTPVGKLLAFFSKDMDTIDDVLVDNLCMYQIFFWILILALGLVTYNLPIFLAICAGLGVVYVYIVRIFIKSSAPLKKHAGRCQSDVIAHTSETLSGLAVVRAFRMEERFVKDNQDFQARSTVITFSLANLALWLAYRVDIIGSLLVLLCCLLAVLSENMNAANAGLIVSNSFQILLFFSIMSRFMGEFHDNMTAVDGAREMAELEAELEPTDEVALPAHWPSQGEIKFEGVVMPYLPGKPPVLKGINFMIGEGEKIGVVGRTGAGKSSLIVALYRLAEISAGKIFVDDIDCSRVNLKLLRSSMAIIPQEPVMFGGTLRTNLDPFNLRSDKELIEALEKCLLGHLVESKEGLETVVETMGSNFSLGTQQLICLARAMLNPSRVLLLDEATAALDSDTNAAVQQVLKANFSDRTIFTIAHRLDTIIDSDRILVMNAGVIAEFDAPDVLLENPDSIFYELCMNTGRSQFEVLAAKARANAFERRIDA